MKVGLAFGADERVKETHTFTEETTFRVQYETKSRMTDPNFCNIFVTHA